VVLFAVYVLGVVAWHAWRTRRTEDVAFALALVIQITLGLHDFLLQLDVLQHQQWYLVHYGSSALCLVLGWMLTRRFVYALDAAEATGADLVRQVEQKRQELELSYRHMHELEQQHAVAEERERIMRDLHDGLGGQLVAALALTRSGVSGQPAIEQTLRDALDDLRVVIDSLDPVEGDLLVLLGTVRGRLEPRLAQQGLHFEWQVSDIPPIPGFTPDKALHVLRIVQEAIANVLKHAKAKAVTIRTGTRPASESLGPAVFIEVADDGAGIATAAAAGRGLGNMRERAARIGARLDLDSNAQGTTVRLWLPLPQAA